MNNVKTPFQYNSVCTKCRAMSASLLKESDYVFLSKKTDLKDIANYLSEHISYSNVFKNIDLSTVNRNFLEQILNQNMYETYMTLYNFTTGNLQKLIGSMKIKYEVDFVLKCIFKIYMNSDDVFNNHFLLNHPKYRSLYNASNFQELLNLLENTPYNKVLKNIVLNEKLDIVYIETLLYDIYYENIYNYYENDDKYVVKLLIIIENYKRMLRLKYKFNLNADQIYPYLIHLNSYQYMNKLMEINNLPDDKFFENIAKNLKVEIVPDNLNEVISIVYFNNFVYNKIKKIFSNQTPSFEIPFAYLSLKEYEIQNLIHIIEGLRYHVSSDEILKYIVGLEG